MNFKMLTPQISLFLFLSSRLIATKILNYRLKVLKQQTSYSSIQHKQAVLLLPEPPQDMGADQQQRSRPPILLDSHFYTSCVFLLVAPCAEWGLYPLQSKKGSANGHTLKAN